MSIGIYYILNTQSKNGKWKPKKELCKSHKRYGRVGTEEDCYFQDRDKKVSKV